MHERTHEHNTVNHGQAYLPHHEVTQYSALWPLADRCLRSVVFICWAWFAESTDCCRYDQCSVFMTRLLSSCIHLLCWHSLWYSPVLMVWFSAEYRFLQSVIFMVLWWCSLNPQLIFLALLLFFPSHSYFIISCLVFSNSLYSLSFFYSHHSAVWCLDVFSAACYFFSVISLYFACLPSMQCF